MITLEAFVTLITAVDEVYDPKTGKMYAGFELEGDYIYCNEVGTGDFPSLYLIYFYRAYEENEHISIPGMTNYVQPDLASLALELLKKAGLYDQHGCR